MNRKYMKYGICSENFSVEITEEVCRKFEAYIKGYDYNLESGGILVGVLNPVHNSIVITDITEPYSQDKRTRYRFQRMENGHQEAMNRLWEQSNYKKTYLGEWHTHKQEQPQPSNIDIKNWIKISGKKSNNSERLFFIIVGTKEVGVWTVLNGRVTKLEMIKTNMEESINEQRKEDEETYNSSSCSKRIMDKSRRKM